MRERHYTGFWRLGAIIQIHILFLGIMALSGCNDSHNTSPSPQGTPNATPKMEDLSFSQLLEGLSEHFQGASGGVQQALGPQGEVIQERTKEEVEKLFRWEYRVVDVEVSLTADELERRLTELGNEGWECFDIAPSGQTSSGQNSSGQNSSGQTSRATCKRRPRSAINYLKLIPGL